MFLLSASDHGLLIDGVAAAQTADQSAEIIIIKNIDISRALSGHAYINWEHKDDPNSIIGRVIYVKKIYDIKDCDNERQLKYWKELELPFLYIIGELFDKEGHPGAVAVAAILRNYVRNRIPITVRWSLEGNTFARDKHDKNILTGTIMKGVAATIKPCNTACSTDIINDVNVIMPAQTNEYPALEQPELKKYITSYEGIYNPILQLDPTIPVKLLVDNLEKALSAGSMGGAPSTLTQGSALQREEIQSPLDKKKKEEFIKSQIMAAYRDWNKNEDLSSYLQKKLPDVHSTFLQKFADLVGQYRLTKNDKYFDELVEKIEKVELEDALENLYKHKLTPDFEKLGVKAYKETPIVSSGTELESKRKSIAQGLSSAFKEHFMSKYGKEYPNTSRTLSQDMLSGSNPFGLTQGNEQGIHSYARSDSLDPIGTKVHEDFHATMHSVANKHGNYKTRKLIDHIYDSMPDYVKQSLDAYVKIRSPKGHPPHIAKEEKLAYMLTYLNSPQERDFFWNRLEKLSGMQIPKDAKREFDLNMKDAYKHLKKKAKSVSFK